MIFDSKDREDMKVAVWAIGIAADHIKCSICGRYWDTIDPCCLCNVTLWVTGRKNS